MMRLLVLGGLVAGCSHSKGPDSPVAAARCEAAAIRAHSFARLKDCLLPVIRDEAERQAARIDWSKLGEAATKLEAAAAKDFAIEPTPEGKQTYGDQVASLPLGHDSLEVVHTGDGSWYIVDTGL
jgi:hypothetical protein